MNAEVEMNLNAAGLGTLVLNGADISNLCQGVEVSSFPGKTTKVALYIGAALKDIKLKAGMLVINGVDLPEEMERALWQHLAEKYGSKPDDQH